MITIQWLNRTLTANFYTTQKLLANWINSQKPKNLTKKLKPKKKKSINLIINLQ